ncbi:MAG: FixH family protein [Gemmatimonadetes bacterium]|nr:FixH family protein [Gemmatimonadota bacterium]
MRASYLLRVLVRSAVLSGLLLGSGCRGDGALPDSPYRLDLSISPTPPAVGPARLIITLTDSAGSPVEGAEIVVEGNMSHAGMVPVIDTAQAEDPGRYGINDFTFTMAGDWVLTTRGVLPDGDSVIAETATNVVGRVGG